MPKVDIDYSNTIIYKIFCKDTNIKNVYVGHTTNFVQRKYAHKQSCINGYKCKLYQTITDNGGWDNWTMEIINFFNCENQYEARKKEQEYFILLNADLNSTEPLTEPNKKNIPIYIEKSIPILNNVDKLYFCKHCHYSTSRKSQYERHLFTPKHTRFLTIKNDNKKVIDDTSNKIFNCCCGNAYIHQSGLSRHKKCCKGEKPKNTIQEDLIKQLILQNQQLIIDNKEFKELMIEQNNKMLELVTTSHSITNIVPL
jgi:hypothetical protein